MTIAKNRVATIHYVLKNDAGEVLEDSHDGDPMEYLHGLEELVTGLEKALEGRKAGDTFSVTVPPAEGFGDYDEDLVESVPLDEFDSEEPVTAGMEFSFEDDEGEIHNVVVKAIEGDEALVDENHPLAGQTLHYAVEVLSVREATAEEIEHGHVHDAHGHHHDHD